MMDNVYEQSESVAMSVNVVVQKKQLRDLHLHAPMRQQIRSRVPRATPYFLQRPNWLAEAKFWSHHEDNFLH